MSLHVVPATDKAVCVDWKCYDEMITFCVRKFVKKNTNFIVQNKTKITINLRMPKIKVFKKLRIVIPYYKLGSNKEISILQYNNVCNKIILALNKFIVLMNYQFCLCKMWNSWIPSNRYDFKVIQFLLGSYQQNLTTWDLEILFGDSAKCLAL